MLKEMWPPLGTQDFSPYLTDIKSINPPVTYDFMPGADGVRFIQQYSEFGLKEKMPFTGFTAIDSQTVSALGKTAIGIMSAVTYTDTLDNPESKAFAADFKTRYKYSPDLFADYGYVGAKALSEALISDRWRFVRQGQARRGDEQGFVQCAARAVSHGPGDAQSDPECLHRAGRSQRRWHLDQNSPYGGERAGPGQEGLLKRPKASRRRPSEAFMELFVAQLLNGLVYGVLLFLMAAGLSLIFGLMNVVSLATVPFSCWALSSGCRFFNLLGVFGWRLCWRQSRWFCWVFSLKFCFFLCPLYRRGHMDQVLLTFGFTFVFLDLVQQFDMGSQKSGRPAPPALQGTMQIGLGVFSAYRLSLIAFGFAVAVLLWLFLERSRIGATVRAGVDNSAMAVGLGANIPALFSGIFGFGVALAALGGIAAAPVLGVYPGNGYGHPHSGVHRHCYRRHGQPARRVRGQSPHRRLRHVRQGIFPERRVVPDLPGDDHRPFDPAARPIRHQIFQRCRCTRCHHRDTANHRADAHCRTGHVICFFRFCLWRCPTTRVPSPPKLI